MRVQAWLKRRALAGRTIFISYRRVDAAGYAFSLHKELKEWYGGQTIFFDRADIPAQYEGLCW